jgi:hypothetical protein
MPSDPYHTLPTSDLENLLRQPNLPAADRTALQAELTRRYASHLHTTPPPQPSTAPPPMPPAQPLRHATPTTPPHPPMTPRPAAATPQRRSRKGLGLTVVLLLIIAALYAIYSATNDSGSGPTPGTGTLCVVPGIGNCFVSESPIGSPCQCTDGIRVDIGTVQ